MRPSRRDWPRSAFVAAILLAGHLYAEAGAGAAAALPAGRFPCAGFGVEPPAGWKELQKDKAPTVAQWTTNDSTGTDMKAILTLEAAHAAVTDLTVATHKLAATWGKVQESAATLDGAPARRVRVTPAATARAGVSVSDAIVCLRGGIAYVMIAAAAKGHTATPEFESLVQSWKWVAFEPPARHLEALEHPIAIFNGGATINFPRLMYSAPTPHPDRAVDLALYNPRADATEFLAYAQLVTIKDGEVFDSIKAKLLEGLVKKGTFDPPPAWSERPGPILGVITQPVAATVPVGKTTEKQTVRWALVSLDAKHVVLLNFVLRPADGADLPAYAAAAEAVVDSIRPPRLEPGTQPASPR